MPMATALPEPVAGAGLRFCPTARFSKVQSVITWAWVCIAARSEQQARVGNRVFFIVLSNVRFSGCFIGGDLWQSPNAERACTACIAFRCASGDISVTCCDSFCIAIAGSGGLSCAPMAISIRIKDLPDSERPRERLAEKGADALKNSELIAILLRTGLKGASVILVAEQ